jgi:formylglycine-generating enzyme required for sulfatase activity
LLSLLLLSFLVFFSVSTWAAQYEIFYKDEFGKPAGSFVYKGSYALLVGISNYTTEGWKLPGVKKDIELLKKALEQHGFYVVTAMDVDLDGLEKVYEDFKLRYGLDPDNRLLFYFAGHGYTIKPPWASEDQRDWSGVLVARDAPHPEEDQKGFLSHVFYIERFASLAREIYAKHVLFVFDSCVSGARGFALSVETPKDSPRRITKQTGEVVRQFISAGTADQSVPDDGKFRDRFVAALEGEADSNGDGYVTGSELGAFLQKQVSTYREYSRQKPQTPLYGKMFEAYLSKGDFIFPLGPPTPPPCIAAPLPPRLNTTTTNSLDMRFVLIPAAEFIMGTNEMSSVRPSHRVTIRQPFYISRHEVTQAQWLAVMGKNPSYFTGDPKLPVENVSWNEVQEFIRHLNAKEGIERYRLPTEAEWELAARTCTEAREEEAPLEQYAWYDKNAGKRTHAVGQLKPNGRGLYDMIGNVWEWCQDWYGGYPAEAKSDPQGSVEGAFRVYRGGGWYRGESPLYCRLESRHGARPNFRHSSLGFRLVMTIPQEMLR